MEFCNNCGDCNSSIYRDALNKIERDQKYCNISGGTIIIGPTGPTGPTGPSGGPTGPTAPMTLYTHELIYKI